MNPTGLHTSRSGRLGELALWTSASILVLAVHIGAAAAILHQEPVDAGDNAPPAAIMIELAAAPEAVNTEEDQIAEQADSSQEIQSANLQPVVEPEPVPEPVEPPPEEIVEPVEPPPPEEVPEPVEPEPEPEVTETIPEPVEEIDPIETQMLAALENIEVPLPTSRPPPPPVEKKKPVKKIVRKPPPQASKASEEAKVRAKQSDRTAARQTTAGSSSSSVSPAKWQSRLMAHLERRKRYPASARSKGEQGTAYVRFRIDNGGNVISVSLSRSSGHASLDQEVVSMVKRASPVPAPPPGVNTTIVAPVAFTIR